jgi:hypothetical protein
MPFLCSQSLQSYHEGGGCNFAHMYGTILQIHFNKMRTDRTKVKLRDHL